MKQLRAVLYLRLSQSDDASTSIDRQERDLRALAEREGWEIAAVLTDDGISGRKARANAAESLRMLRAGDVDVLAVWKFDRWSRQGLGAVADLIAALDARPHTRFVALQDGLRSDQPAWRIIASVLAEVARMEADNTAMRVSSSIAALRRGHRFPGGVVPFGYHPAPLPGGIGRMLVVDPPEAAIVLEVAERVLDGHDSLVTIALDLTQRGVPATRSAARSAAIAGRPTDGLSPGVWRSSGVSAIWSSDTLLGRTTHQGAIVRGPDGLPAQVWEPILDLATALQLRDKLRAGPGRPQRPRAARLLSGLAYCAVCGTKMYVRNSGKEEIYYGCSASGRGLDCVTPRIKADLLEEYIERVFLLRLGNSPETTTQVIASDPMTSASLVEVEASLKEVSGSLLRDDADVVSIMAQIDRLKASRSELRAIDATVTEAVVETGRTRAEAWLADPDVFRRREVLIESGMLQVRVQPRRNRTRGLDPTRVDIIFADDAEVASAERA